MGEQQIEIRQTESAQEQSYRDVLTRATPYGRARNPLLLMRQNRGIDKSTQTCWKEEPTQSNGEKEFCLKLKECFMEILNSSVLRESKSIKEKIIIAAIRNTFKIELMPPERGEPECVRKEQQIDAVSQPDISQITQGVISGDNAYAEVDSSSETEGYWQSTRDLRMITSLGTSTTPEETVVEKGDLLKDKVSMNKGQEKQEEMQKNNK